MGLQVSMKIDGTNATATNSYTRIGAMRFDHPNRVYLRADTFWTKTKADDGEKPFQTHELTLNCDDFGGKSKVTLANAYTAIKQVDGWTDATDVIEE